MSERKNLDKLFQEKFKDFEMDPPEHTWPELEEKLKKKKDRKVIPFWWRLSGIAAAFLLGFFVANRLGLFDNGNEIENRVVIQEKKDQNGAVNEHAITGPNPDRPQQTIAQSDADTLNKKNAAAETSDKVMGTSTENAVAEASDNGMETSPDGNKNTASGNENTRSRATKNQINNYKSNHHDAIVKTSETRNHGGGKKRKGQTNHQKTNGYNQEQTAIVANERANLKSNGAKIQDGQSPGSENTPTNQTTNNGSNTANTAVAQKNKPEVKSLADNQNQKTVPIDAKAVDSKANPVVSNEGKTQEKKLDSTALAMTVPNALEELLNEKENKVTKEPKLNRWRITSNVAPIYFGSTSGGSPIDSTFAGNSKDYNTQVSYGIGVNYAINKKFTIRAGVNKVSLNYDTNDVELYAGLNQGGLSNLDSPAETEFLNFGRAVAANRSNTAVRSETALVAGDIATDKFTGSINQKMGYIEVPVEVSYAVINRKFGVNVIAGVSTLFLNENKVIVVSDGLMTDLGQANNLNKTHFSTNIGLGVKYTFLKSFEASFEPIFKYQLNTFSKDSGDFKPYFFGLYTGVSFRF